MTLLRRVIACLDVRGGRVVKGTRFIDVADVGDPVAMAAYYEQEGADEIVFLDISATAEDRATVLDLVRQTAERVFIPLTIGGGIRTPDDARRALRAGADKVSINSSAVARPAVLTECAERFGSQCVVASIDARRSPSGWEVYVRGGTVATGLDAVEWASNCAEAGAGEILLTSIDRDGTRSGYDLALMRSVSAVVSVPVVASGGAGSSDDVVEVLSETPSDAALVAGMLHDGSTTIGDIKRRLVAARIPVR